MTWLDYISSVFAAWAITYHLCFGQLFEWLRRRVGINFDLDDCGRPTDRWGANPLAEFLNCPTCVAILATGSLAIMWYNGYGETIRWLAVLGGATVISRWWTAQRTKADWWR